MSTIRALARIARGVLCIAAVGTVASAHAVEVTKIRYSSIAERTRVVVDLDRSAAYRHRTLSDPPRVIVTLEGGSAAAGLRAPSIGDGWVDGVRVNDLSSRLQVVLDLSKASEYRTFTLENPPRIVIDVFHEGGPASEPPPTPKPVPVDPLTSTPDPAPSTPDPEPAKVADPAPRESAADASAGSKPTARAPTVSVERKVIPADGPERTGPWRIAVDAGHGGDDHGCRYHRTSEKDIVLALAREVTTAIDRLDNMEAVLIRKGDYFLPLRKRRSLAEEKEADLFVSLHCNASTRAEARGTEVFFLSLDGASDEAAHELARRENSVDEKMGVAPGGDLGGIVFDMVQTDVVAKSEILAEYCLESLFGLGTVYNRGVKQAGFAVLKSPTMPSVLVEAAFLSNKEENRLLRDPGWQRRFGQLLAEGIAAYCRSMEPAGSTPGAAVVR